MTVIRRGILDRFFTYVPIGDPDDCWSWEGTLRGEGYPVLTSVHFPDGKKGNVNAHRFSYEFFSHSQIPEGLTIDHLCRNRSCVNPRHLEVVTMRENTMRGATVTARNAQKKYCVNGHEFTEQNTYVRATGHRSCIACLRARARKYAERR